MKISHSLIILISLIFLTGSMITLGMGVKRKTNNIYANVEVAKQMHFQKKEMYLQESKKNEQRMDGQYHYVTSVDKINKHRIARKLKSLNQN